MACAVPPPMDVVHLTVAEDAGNEPLSPTTPVTGRASADVKVFSFIDTSRPAFTLAWEDLTFSVGGAKKVRKEILHALTGDLRPGELTCILGPSGSGKTSLLNILAGRVRRGGRSQTEITGQVRVNGKVIDPACHQQLFGYVMQDDALLGTMTPREVLQFSARLRLDDEVGDSRDLLIADLLRSMGLTRCADTNVGNELIKGISGGERKRTAVAAELITNPQVTFLDEPTSGLDTGAAYDVIAVLKQLTKLNRSVLCTIHQPSSEIIHMFDQAIFLVGGDIAYHGPPSGIRPHFSKIGFVCPEDYNPADFVMFCIQTDDEVQIGRIVSGWKECTTKRPAVTPSGDVTVPPLPRRKGLLVELATLSVREFRKTIRDKATLGARFGSTIFLALIYGLVFFRIGSADTSESTLVKRDSYEIQSHAGALTMLGISSMFGAAQPLLLTFSSERPVFIREYASNLYGPLPYFLSKSAVEIPLVFAQNVVQFLVAYWLMGLRGNWIMLVVAATCIGLAAASTALLAACLVQDSKQAMEAAPALFVPQILFAGFFIKMQFVPVFMRWLQYLCSLKWGMNILWFVEFYDVPGGNQMLLKTNEIEKDLIGLYFGVLMGIFFGFRILAAIALARKARGFYN